MNNKTTNVQHSLRTRHILIYLPQKNYSWQISVICSSIIGLSRGAIQRPDYDDTPSPEFLNPSWMASLPDDQPLSEVTMPGTHNTMALYGGVFAECQTWSLASQLRAGVRFLDVRVRYFNGNLTIHHGVSYQWAHFGHVLEGVADFLVEYPSETVLMRVKEEYSETYDIYGAVVDYVRRYADWDLLWHSRLVPTMGEARGKLVVLQDFPGPDLGMRYDSLDIADDWRVRRYMIHSYKGVTCIQNNSSAQQKEKRRQLKQRSLLDLIKCFSSAQIMVYLFEFEVYPFILQPECINWGESVAEQAM